MNIVKSSQQEIKKLLTNSFFRLAVFVIACLPLLYGVLYLWAFWDPYAKLNNIPVAVVNQDEEVQNSQNESVNYGDELVDNLKENNTLEWDFVTQDEADQGLQNYKYYAEIIIPSDFSKNIVSISSDNPSKAIIEYKARESNNMIAAQLTNRVTEEITKNLNNKITSTSIEQIFLGIRNSADSLQVAADGSSQIVSAQSSAINGAQKILDGINTAATGSNDLSAAIKTASDGTLALASGTNDLYNGMKKFNSGLSDLGAATTVLLNSSQSLSDGISTVNTGVNTYINANTTIMTNIETANQLLKDPDTINPTYKIPNKYVAAQILSSIVTQATSTESQTKIASLQTGLSQLVSGSAQLASGTSTLNSSVNNSVINSGKTIESGLEKTSTASNTLASGMNEIYSGSQKLASGNKELADGQTQLINGLNDINSGTTTLSDKLSSGASTAKVNTTNEKINKLVPIISQPVETSDISISKIINYGTGFAPYFIPLSLWVGGLVLFLLIKLNPINKDEEKMAPWKLILSKFITSIKISTIQTIILDCVLIFGLGIRATNYIQFFSFTILASWCFVAILEFFILILQDGGKFLGILLLMLQLTSASGTYPIETTPTFFQKINPYLPMTYVVKGLREIITGANTANIVTGYWIVSGFLLGALFLSLISAKVIKNRRLNLNIETQYEY